MMMQRLKKAALSKLRSTTPSSPLPFHRIFSQSANRCFFSEPSQSPPNPITKVDPNQLRNQNEVLVEGKANARTAILNRPSKLNAITYSMAARLNKLYASWEENADIGFVTMRGNGRAFCAGGDVVALYNSINQGKVEECKEFFGTLYKFIYLLGTYTKPHVAVMDGFTLGCGAGVGIPGTFRVATDKTVFATPETQIGFHPDAGASFYLSRLPGYLGEYLALTGEKLNGVEMVTCGLATHYALHENLSVIEERLAKLITDLPSVVGASLTLYGQFIYPDRRSVLHRIEAIDRCFSQDTVEDIIHALENEAAATNQEWCILALKRLKEASPLSLKISLRSIREGRFQPLELCLRREFRMSARAVSKHVSNDFCEGVRALLLDKDYAPKWDPPCLEQVSKDMVDFYFAPFPEFEPELDLPTTFREPFI